MHRKTTAIFSGKENVVTLTLRTPRLSRPPLPAQAHRKDSQSPEVASPGGCREGTGGIHRHPEPVGVLRSP